MTTFEKSTAITHGVKCVCMISLALGFALLASGVVIPGQTGGYDSISSNVICLVCRFALPPSHTSTCVSRTVVFNEDLQVSDLASETETEEQDQIDCDAAPLVSFETRTVFIKACHCQVTSCRSLGSYYPLRC